MKKYILLAAGFFCTMFSVNEAPDSCPYRMVLRKEVVAAYRARKAARGGQPFKCTPPKEVPPKTDQDTPQGNRPVFVPERDQADQNCPCLRYVGLAGIVAMNAACAAGY